MKDNQKYLAFLRGINVGGHHKVPMAELKREMGRLGFEKVETLLNSGNVIFEAPEQKERELEENIAAALQQHFGFTIPVLVRRAEYLLAFISRDPFNQVEITKDIRLYVSFLKQPSTVDEAQLPKTGAFRILEVRDRAVFSVLDLSETKTVKGMEVLEKLFGKELTTRNWKTLGRMAAKVE